MLTQNIFKRCFTSPQQQSSIAFNTDKQTNSHEIEMFQHKNALKAMNKLFCNMNTHNKFACLEVREIMKRLNEYHFVLQLAGGPTCCGVSLNRYHNSNCQYLKK